MLQIKNLSKSFSDRVLFRNSSLYINKNERIALIGPNGSGKTTLFRIIMGREDYDSGELIVNKNIKLGFLPQEIEVIKGSNLLAEVMRCLPELEVMQKQMEELEMKLSKAKESDLKQHLEDYEQVQSKFEESGGYGLKFQAKKILVGLGFKGKDFFRATDEFSGGWLMRIALAKLLFNPPELMMLDEPTNHLDLESLLWLQNYLHSYNGALIFTSHDRAFINDVATRVVDIDRAKLVSYRGNYDNYVEGKKKHKELLVATHKTQERKIKQAQKFIDRFRATASKASLVQSRIKTLEKMKKIEISKEKKKIRFHFPQPSRSGYEVIVLKDIYKSYGDNEVYRGIDFTLYRQDKIALVGPNGAGKSTLLKILADVLGVDKGVRTIGHNVNAGYYPQHRLDMLNMHNTCLEEIGEVYPNRRETDIRKLLGRFLFSGDDVYKKVSVLSGGEKSKLILAKILSNPPNFLLMDEPINHLDITSRDILIEALTEFTGTLCFISHDEYFIRKVANKIIEIKNGMLHIYPGGYDYYIYKKELEKKNSNQINFDEAKRIKPGKRAVTKPNQEKKEKDILNKRLSEIEKELSKLSARLDELNKILSEPQNYKNNNFISLAKEYNEVNAKVDTLTTEWEQYAEKLAKYEIAN